MPKSDTTTLDDATAESDQKLFDQAMSGDADATLDEGAGSLEGKRPGLEGDVEGDEPAAAADETTDAETEVDAAGDEPDADAKGQQPRAKDGTFAKKDDASEEQPEEPRGGVPPARLRQQTERLRASEAERAAERERFEQSQRDMQARVDRAERMIDDLRRSPPVPRPEPKVEEPPDMFVDPAGYAKHVETRAASLVASMQSTFSQRLVGMSLASAHEAHGPKFEAAYAAILGEAERSPEGRAAVQRVWNADNPGAALMRWHRDRETLREVGSDPAAYREKVRAELMKDPDFRKQLIAEARGEATGSGNGNGTSQPRTITRLPSLNRAAGGQASGTRLTDADDNPKSHFDAAWID